MKPFLQRILTKKHNHNNIEINLNVTMVIDENKMSDLLNISRIETKKIAIDNRII
jgi:hypothetical protein